MELVWSLLILFGGIGSFALGMELLGIVDKRKKSQKALTAPVPAEQPQLGPYRTADVLAIKPVQFLSLTDMYDELKDENKYLREVVQRLTICADREMWRQGMLDAAAIIKSITYTMPNDPGFTFKVRSFLDAVRGNYIDRLKRYADYPEESKIPMLPISPHAATKVGTLK